MGIYTDTVQKMYVAFFNRPADALGQAFWESQMANGTTEAQVAAAFAGSAEYKALYAGLDTAAIVANLYTNLFGRTAAANEVLFWGTRMLQGLETVDTIARTLANSAQGTDATAIANKIAAANAFTTALDTTAEIVGYSGMAANESARQWLATVTDTTASLTAATGSINTAITSAVDAGNVAAGKTYSLTIGVDTITGGTGADTINANYDVTNAAATLSALDNIDGGAGNDTLNDTATAAISVPSTATVKNVETVNLTSGSTVDGDVSGWTGLTTLNVTEAGGTNGSTVTAAATTNVTLTDTNAAAATISVDGGKNVTVVASKVTTGGTINVGATTAPKGAVSVTATELSTETTNTADAINVTGGTTVTITANLAGKVNNTITGGAIAVTGTADTTSVSVTQTAAVAAAAAVSGVVDGGVTINDLNAGSATEAATISSVTLANYGNSTISSNALSTLSLSGTAGTLGITSGLTTETVTTLDLTVNKLSGANTITDVSNHFKTINITTTGADSTIANFADTAATALTVAGDHAVTFTSVAGLSALKTVTVSGSAGLTADVSGIATVTDVNASATSGTNSVTVKSTQMTYEGGSGADTVTIAEAPTKAISGGAGADTLVINVAAATFSNPSANSNISGFETLGLGAAATGSYNATGFSHLTEGAVTGAVTYTNVAAGTDLTITASPTAATTYTLADASGTSDALTVTMKAAGAIVGNTLTAAGIESVSISATDSTSGVTAGATADSLTLVATSAKTITVTGNTTLTLTNTGNTAVTTIDASGMTGGIVVTTAGTVAETVKGGATANILTAGVGTTNDTLIGGAAADTLKANAGLDTLTGGAGADTFEITLATANGNTYSTITDAAKGDIIQFDMSVGALTKGQDITSTLNAGTAVFQDYLNKAIADSAAADKIDWFTFGGNTYVVENVSAGASFANTTDVVIKLTGIVDLSTATFGGGAGAGTITLA